MLLVPGLMTSPAAYSSNESPEMTVGSSMKAGNQLILNCHDTKSIDSRVHRLYYLCQEIGKFNMRACYTIYL